MNVRYHCGVMGDIDDVTFEAILAEFSADVARDTDWWFCDLADLRNCVRAFRARGYSVAAPDPHHCKNQNDCMINRDAETGCGVEFIDVD